MNKYIIALRTAGIPPVQVHAHRYTRGDKFTIFTDEKANEVAWFNTAEIGGMWIVNEENLIAPGVPQVAMLGRKN